MSISGRKLVKWDDGEWEEHTSTLVLASRKHNYYTDLRILDKNLPPRAALSQCLPSPPSPIVSTPPKVPSLPPQVEWAFAGTFESTHGKDEEGHNKKDTVWNHWIDSHFSGEVLDSGSSFDYGDRGENLSIEKGRALNPSTGEEQAFQEIWLEFPVDSISSVSYSPKSSTPSSQSGSSSRPSSVAAAAAVPKSRPQIPSRSKICMVLRAESNTFSIRGLVVRVGAWCQGIIKTGHETSAERWRWVQHEGGGEGGWEQVVKIGTGSVPCRSLWEKEDLEVGDDIQSSGLRWELVEKEVWQ